MPWVWNVSNPEVHAFIVETATTTRLQAITTETTTSDIQWTAFILEMFFGGQDLRNIENTYQKWNLFKGRLLAQTSRVEVCFLFFLSADVLAR